MSALPFPPRHAGSVLAAAMDAAEQAGAEEAARRAGELFWPWGGRFHDHESNAGLFIQQAALDAASPLLRGLTADAAMVDIVAHGMAEEVMIRLRKRGAA